jgi:peroxiredoxin
MTAFPEQLPDGLPVPEDDGAADHLPGTAMPALALPATDGRTVDLSAVGRSTVDRTVDLSAVGAPRAIVYVYPRTGRPGVDVPDAWDAIPGARGCTPESCGFRDHHAELAALGAEVYGLSAQSTPYQAEAVERLRLPFALLSDERLALAAALRLPTFEFEGARLYRRITLVVRDGAIEHVFYPVFPPDEHAERVLEWLRG